MSLNQMYSGRTAPLRLIVGVGDQGVVGQWVLLECGHWRQIRDYNIMPAMGRKRPVRARCGPCSQQTEGLLNVGSV
jgi:hypothetical protein